MPLKERIWDVVEVAREGDRASRWFDTLILTLIFLNVLAVILESVPSLQDRYSAFFFRFEIFSVVVFSAEYLLRIWSCSMDPKFKGLTGRLRFAMQPMPLIDLLAILPFFLPFVGADLRSFRVLRLLRILRIAKVGRYYDSLKLIRNVLVNKKEELILTTAVMGFLLIISSSLMYYCEHEAQPDKFSSIPTTMWWAASTLTTVGYGDVTPVTSMGKLWGACIAIIGIGMFALPTGILGAGFVEEIEKTKNSIPAPIVVRASTDMKTLNTTLALILFTTLFTACVTNDETIQKATEVRGLVIAVHMYADDNKGALPRGWESMESYIIGDVNTANYELMAKGNMAEHANPSEVILLQQKLANNKGEWLVAYLDGHIEIHQSDSVEAIPLPKRKKNSRY